MIGVVVVSYKSYEETVDYVLNQLSKLDDYEATSFVVYDVEGNFKPFN